LSVSFGGKALPTKIELIRIRKSLQTSKTVHKILEDKRDVLLKRLDEMINAATSERDNLSDPLSEAYNSLYDAYIKMGSVNMNTIALTSPSTINVDVDVSRMVDVDIPKLKISSEDVGLSYGFADTSIYLDNATKVLREVLPQICRAAELENAIFRLAAALEKTQRMINALEFIIIPQYLDSIKFIQSTLEEREREEFVRLKQVKKVLENRTV
jgi:V/A-type H+-transporting ATPase subunit D|tara:strand:+ start:2267 stop:2905 length:639 start_codon:yes stop_codon:yes gene_type:complete